MTTQATGKVADEALRRRELARIAAARSDIAAICRRYEAARLNLFGSITHEGEFGPDSDIDLLVKFRPGVTHGFSFGGMEAELEELLGRRVQLVEAEDLSPYFRQDVVLGAEPIYVHAIELTR